MVPYIRLSFFKHFCDGIEFIYDNETLASEFKNKYKRREIMDISIEDKSVYRDTYSKAYRYAMKKTIKETEQAVEGMFHNLNTLQSRSGEMIA